jgi:hypothetical protein
MARDEKIVRADGLAVPLQAGLNPCGGFRRRPIQREFNDGGHESLDFLSLPGWVLGFLNQRDDAVGK